LGKGGSSREEEFNQFLWFLPNFLKNGVLNLPRVSFIYQASLVIFGGNFPQGLVPKFYFFWFYTSKS